MNGWRSSVGESAKLVIVRLLVRCLYCALRCCYRYVVIVVTLEKKLSANFLTCSLYGVERQRRCLFHYDMCAGENN